MSESQWTLETLIELFQSKLDALERLLNERYTTQTKAIDKAFNAQQTAMHAALQSADKAVQAALAAAEQARLKAEDASKDRFESVNKFREQQTDLIARFATRDEIEVRLKAISDRLDALSVIVSTQSKRLDLNQGGDEGRSNASSHRSSSSAVIAQWVGLVIVGIGVLITLILSFTSNSSSSHSSQPYSCQITTGNTGKC